jgi:hypothetical protein
MTLVCISLFTLFLVLLCFSTYAAFQRVNIDGNLPIEIISVWFGPMICMVFQAFDTQKKNQTLMRQLVRYARDVLICVVCAMPSYLWLANKGLVEQASPFIRQAAMLLLTLWASFLFQRYLKSWR